MIGFYHNPTKMAMRYFNLAQNVVKARTLASHRASDLVQYCKEYWDEVKDI